MVEDLTDEITDVKDIFPDKYNCSQTVLRMILMKKNLYFSEVPLVAAGFGGGIAHRGETCGAVVGAIMAIGVLYGQTIKDPVKHKAATYKSVAEFIEEFNEIHDTTVCNSLVGIEMADSVARKKANDEGIFHEICPKYVDTAIALVLKMFKEI